MGHIQTCHVLMGNFGIDTDKLRVIERRDQSEVSASRCKIDIGTWFIRLSLKGKTITVTLIAGILTKIVKGITKALDGIIGTPAPVRLNSFTTSPEDKYFSA